MDTEWGTTITGKEINDPNFGKPKKMFPVVEIFGPTIQGEGALQGIPCHFIRFGGCDYKCDWCDSPHAVLPHLVRQAERLSQEEILKRIRLLAPAPGWIVLSGGNPCLHNLSELITQLQLSKFYIALETQGTKWKYWVKSCNSICISPKPPSSGMPFDLEQLTNFVLACAGKNVFLKVVVFDALDYDFARVVRSLFPGVPMYLSAGNDAGSTVGNVGRKDERTDQEVAFDLINRGRWLANRVMVDPLMSDVRVQMQQHVLYWGNQRGR